MTSKATSVTTNEVRISYEHMVKPYASKPNEEPKFSATLLIPKTDIATRQRLDAAIQAAIMEGVTSKWNGVRPPQVPSPIHDGDGPREDGTAYSQECRGHWVVTASSKQRQDVVDMNVSPIIDATQIYSGMYARVCVNFFAYSNNGKKGIGCGLGPVQKTRDGEPLGGRMTASEAFGGVSPSYPAQPAYQSQPQQPSYPQQPAYPQYPQYAQQPQPQPQYPAYPSYPTTPAFVDPFAINQNELPF